MIKGSEIQAILGEKIVDHGAAVQLLETISLVFMLSTTYWYKTVQRGLL